MRNFSHSIIFDSIVKVSTFRILSIIISGMFIFLVSRHLSPSDFGYYNLVISIFQTVCAFAINWPNQAFLRLGRESFSRQGHFGSYWCGRLILQVISLSFLLTVFFIFNDYFTTIIGVNISFFSIILPLFFIIVPLQDLFMTAAQAAGKLLSFGLIPLIQKIAQLSAVVIGIIFYESNWELLICALLAAHFFSAFSALKFVPRDVFRFKISFRSTAEIFGYSWSMPLAILLTFVLTWMDIWIIKYFYELKEVGLYSLAFTISLMIMSIMVPISASIAPMVIDFTTAEDRSHLSLLLNKFHSSTVFIASLLPLAAVFGESVMGWFLPENYQKSVPILLVLSSAIICQISLSILGPIIYSQKKLVPKMMFVIFLMVIMKAVINFLILDDFGLIGPAIVTVTCFCVGMFFQWRMVKKYLNYRGNSELMFLVLTLILFGLLHLARHIAERVFGDLVQMVKTLCTPI